MEPTCFLYTPDQSLMASFSHRESGKSALCPVLLVQGGAVEIYYSMYVQ